MVVLGLHCLVPAFSSCSERGLLFIAVVSLVVEHGLQQLPHTGFSSWGSQALEQSLCSCGLAASWHVESSLTRDQTRVPCIGRQILTHCATREILCIFFSCFFVRVLPIMYASLNNMSIILACLGNFFFYNGIMLQCITVWLGPRDWVSLLCQQFSIIFTALLYCIWLYMNIPKVYRLAFDCISICFPPSLNS